jgi:hypothetical protein
MRIVLIAAAFVLAASTAHAAGRQAVIINGSEQVIHSRRAPVVLHRAVPPFKGVHVYQGRIR